MSKTAWFLVAVAAAVPLFLGGVALWVWVTIPPAPDPEALPSRVAAPPSAAHLDAVEGGRSIARSLVAEEKLPGLSLAVAVDGEIVWAEGFRYRDMESRAPVTPATRFRIGGVSEIITAAAVGLLSERGRLDLDAPVQRYLPGFPEKDRPVSTRRLMAHTGGVRDLRGEGELFRKTGCADDPERLAIFAGDPLRFRPGSQCAYSAYGQVLVGAVAAAAAGEPYLDFVRREILVPLAMESTVPDVAGRPDPDAARFYYPRLALDPRYGLQDAPPADLSCILPAGGFLSTPADLVRLGSALLGDRDTTLLDPMTVEELQTPLRLASGQPAEQALGFSVRRIPLGADGTATRIVGQGLDAPVRRRPLSATALGGQVPGGTATLLIVPEHHLVVAVTANVSGAGNVPQLAIRLADLFVRSLQAP